MARIVVGLIGAAFCMACLTTRAEAPFRSGASFPTGPEPWGTVIADFDNDGHADVAIADFAQPGVATVLLGDGQGGFAFASATGVDKASNGIAAGDFDGDGLVDLVVSSISNDASDIVSVLLGRGDGTFEDAVAYPVGGMPGFVAVADVNMDGHPDVVTENSNGNSISVLLGVGDGSFTASVDYDLGLSPMNLVVTDVDGDGKPDVAVSANSFFASFAILKGNGDGTFGAPRYGGVGGHVFYGIAVADIDRDGRMDVALLDRGGSEVEVFLAQGGSTYADPVATTTDADVSSIAVADLFKNGRVEVITAGGSGARLFVAEPDGALRDAGALPGIVGGASIAIGDLDGDGMPDIVAPSYLNFESNALLNLTIFRDGFD
jgi:hypothetical protein